MSPNRSPKLRVRARGFLACFTRPELKVERVSYPVMTPSAARGLLEAIHWKPGMRWRIQSIHVLAPIRFISFRRNEVNAKAPIPAASVVADGGPAPLYYADADRAQRNTVALRDVDYVIEARIEMTERAGPSDNLTKFVEMFQRRISKGQHFHHPYLGCREFAAAVTVPEDDVQPITDSRDLGIMLWDIEHPPDGRRAQFFKASLDEGILHVPDNPEATIPGGDGMS